MLARRDYSRHELTQKLLAKGANADLLHNIVNELSAKGLIQERRFAENFLYWRKNRGLGPLRIMQELQARGIDASLIAEIVHVADECWFSEVRKIWQKHFKGRKPKDYAERAKQMRFLQYRGYTREQIESIWGRDG